MASTDEIDVAVTGRVEAATGVVLLDLEAADGSPLPDWQPGAHIDVLLPGGERQYSLCGDPAQRAVWQVAVLREKAGRGGSAFVHDQLFIDAKIRVRGPRNHFPLLPAARYRFVAGGIGITPLLPMIAAVERSGADWTLDYAGATSAAMAFADRLAGTYGERVRLHPGDQRRLDLAELLGTPEADTLVYACGPTRMLAAIEQTCAGWAHGSLHLEHFEATNLHEAVHAESFEVELADSGITITVPPDRSVLEMIEEAGVLVLSSCREGTCGTCETTVLAGEVDHRDSVLTPDEQAANDIMMVCCSRALGSKLVLEL